MFSAMDFWAFIFCLLVAVLYTVLYGKRNKLHQYIALFSACVAGILLSDCLAWFFRGADNMLVILKVSNFFSFFFSYLVNIPFVLYIYGAADKKPGPGAWVVFSCLFASFVLLCVSQWNGLLYYFDADNLYHRNNRWYWLVSFFYVIENITMFIILFVHRKRILKGRFYGILIILLTGRSLFNKNFQFQDVLETSANTSLLEEAVIVPHHQVGLDLTHSVQYYTDKNQNACSSKEAGHIIIDLEVAIHRHRNNRNDRQEDRTRQSQTAHRVVQEITGHLAGSDTGDIPAVLRQIV